MTKSGRKEKVLNKFIILPYSQQCKTVEDIIMKSTKKKKKLKSPINRAYSVQTITQTFPKKNTKTQLI